MSNRVFDPATDLNARQYARYKRWLSDIRQRSKSPVKEDEIMWAKLLGGSFITAAWFDYANLFHLTMDVYGNGPELRADIEITHDSANEDCDCDECRAEKGD